MTVARIGELLHGGPVDPDEVARVRETVIFEEPNRSVKLVRFWCLLTLAAAISTFGLLSNSVATVIGAMIVAPLMLPIVGLAFGVSIGDRRAIGTSLLVGIGGILTAIAVGWMLSHVTLPSFDPEQVDQIMIRTSPNMLDLLAALATGLAGAFAVGRKDVSDTLPGVAIAISLVPPLANVGILLEAGRTDLAVGSLLLFVTNYLAILLTGALVFGLMGYTRVALVDTPVRRKRMAVAVAAVALLVIMVPLGVQSYRVYAKRVAEGVATQAAKEWISDSEYEFVSARATEEGVDIVLVGSGGLPPTEELAAALDGQVFGLSVRVEALGAQRVTFETN